jgi:hypothetical protein
VAGDTHEPAHPLGGADSFNRKPGLAGDSVEVFIHPVVVVSGGGGYRRESGSGIRDPGFGIRDPIRATVALALALGIGIALAIAVAIAPRSSTLETGSEIRDLRWCSVGA